MIKQNKGTLLLITAILLLPMVIGLIVWNKLPEQIPMHWNAFGEVDGYGSRAMLVFCFPLFMVGLQWLGVLASSLDRRNENQNRKAAQLVLWIVPSISLLVHTLIYAKILGYDLAVEIIMPLAFGLLLMVVGNLLPKCKRNSTIGIKLPWTLKNDENWNKTHRLAGKLWVIAGAVSMATAVFGNVFLFFGIVLTSVIVPTVYSYVYYRRHREN